MATEVHRMLYATDLSDRSGNTILSAINYAHQQNAKLIIFYVVNQRAINFSRILATFYDEGDEHRIIQEKVNTAYRRMENLIKIFRQKQVNENPAQINTIEYSVVHYGRIAEEIVEKAKQWACVKIILGPRRKLLLSRILLPSVSRMVRRRSSVHVHIIKGP
jgi:nucleotide-binding universal stress UspA family protein